MHKALLEVLADPISKEPFKLLGEVQLSGDEITQGELKSSGNRSYSILRGIPRFVITEDQGQKQTEKSFGFKWEQEGTYNSPKMRSVSQTWLVHRYGFDSPISMRGFFSSRKRILDAGCGSGFSTSLWMDESWDGQGLQYIGVDISTAIDVAKKQLGKFTGTHFLQADALQLPFRPESFDTIFSEGVLHHTPSTKKALQSLVPLLVKGGEIMFYIYRKKSPLREYSDNYIREIVSKLPPEEAWAQLRPLTKLGEALAKLHCEVDVPEDIPFLGIKSGRQDIQRFLYWNVLKMFWNDSFSFEENNHINFDWFHPRYAHRHTEEEIRSWCDEFGLAITRLDIQESGYTVRATKD